MIYKLQKYFFSLCESKQCCILLISVGGEMELLLKLPKRLPSTWSILHSYPNLHSKYKAIMCNFDGNISNLCLCRINLTTCWPWIVWTSIINCSSIELNINVTIIVILYNTWLYPTYMNLYLDQLTLIPKERGCNHHDFKTTNTTHNCG